MLRGVARDLRKILVAVDFSPESREAMRNAAMLATALDASLTLLHVCSPPSLLNPIVPRADNEADAAADVRAALDMLAAARADVYALGLTHVTLAVEPGSAAETIIGHARRGGFDMIVMGTHGRTGLDRLVMGSVAERVVRSASCPVLTVHLPRSG